MLELVRKHLAAFGTSDWETYKADLAPDATYEEVATGQVSKGRDQYVEAVKRWKTPFPDARMNVLNAYSIGDIVVSELEWVGTHAGPLPTPFGILPPTNQVGSVKAVLINKLKDGKIIEARHYFDLMTVFMQAGAGAAIGALPAKAAATVARPH